jgi:hypothetical protein
MPETSLEVRVRESEVAIATHEVRCEERYKAIDVGMTQMQKKQDMVLYLLGSMLMMILLIAGLGNPTMAGAIAKLFGG